MRGIHKEKKCELVTSLAKELGIDLVYIPPYSPNLNPIERLWKFTKGKLRVKYYSDFKSFKDAIDSIIDGIWTFLVTKLIAPRTLYRCLPENVLTNLRVFE